jgi:RNA polymerase sigma-70 factor (ECF subfamily)
MSWSRSEGDELADLYDRLGPGLYRYALMILADPVGAEDVVHDVFLALARRRREGIAAMEAYLKLAVRNGCYSLLRRRRTRPDAEADAARLEAVGDEEDPAVRLALGAALGRLPPEQREVVHLKAFEGLTFQEIADLTGESINTVAGRYRYALDKLRAELGHRR